MRLTWEKIKRSLGIPDKLTDAEMADEIAGREAERLAEGGDPTRRDEPVQDADGGATERGEAGVLTAEQIVGRPGDPPRPATGVTGAAGTTGGQGSGPPRDRADRQTAPEFTGRDQPQIESGPWGDLAVQDGPRQYSGIPDQVSDDALYSGIDAGATEGIDPDDARRGRGMSVDLSELGHGEAGLRATPRATGGLRFGSENGREEAYPVGNDWQQRDDDGVHVTPTPITLGETVHVKYSGPLAQGGHSPVHLHWGFGPGQWTHVQDVAMERDGDGYKATLNVDKDGRFEFCFHDNEGNWDNNDGRNWSYIIHDGELPGEYVVDRH